MKSSDMLIIIHIYVAGVIITQNTLSKIILLISSMIYAVMFVILLESENE